MTNKRDYTMAKKVAVLGLSFLLVIIIVGIALAVYFGTKKTQVTNELPEDLGPQIDFDGLSAKYNPAPEEAIEGYTIEEYAAEGDINYTELSKSVDLTVGWFNQGGFGNINELVIKRYVGNNVKASKTLKKSNSSESKYFESFSESMLTYTFEGKDVNYSVVGVNKIKIFYKNASNQEVELTPSNLDGYEIKKEDLAQTLDMVSPLVVKWEPSTSDEITVSPDIDRKGYFMYPGGSNKTIYQYIQAGLPHGKVYLVPSGNKNTTIKIKLEHDNKFIKYDNNVFSFDLNNGTEFTLVKGEIDGTIRLRVGDLYVAVKDNTLVMLKTSDITTRDLYKTLDTTITETPAQKQDCEFEWERGELDKIKAERTDTYKIITEAGGGGTPCEYAHNQEVTFKNLDVDCEGDYAEDWTQCSATCGGGTKTLKYIVTVPKQHNGKDCLKDLSENCNTHSCESCKEHQQYLDWQFGGVGVVDPSTKKKCSDYTNKTECNDTWKRTGVSSGIEVCEWK